MPNDKYNYSFKLEKEDIRQGNSAQTKTLQMVSKGATVLECGPADGLMTQYLAKKMHCKVYIIEIDPDRYEHAMQYACGGICANLEEDDWIGNFEDAFFDYILYVDVLEHLRNPEAVLLKMKRYLKPNGSVLLSVPNIANGDIIMNLLCDRFTYTPLGLLDDTHIHFFARQDLHEMIQRTGYHLAYEGFTAVPLFMSEQGGFIPTEQRNELQQLMELHLTRNIYQFICRLTLSKTELKTDIGRIDSYGNIDVLPLSRLYCDTGEGFSEETRQDIKAERLLKERISYQVSLPKGCKAVRYDPIELRGCMLWDTVVAVDGVAVEGNPLNGMRIGESTLYLNEDPQLYIEIPNGGRVLRIETSIRLLNSVQFHELSTIAQQFHCTLRDQDIKLITAQQKGTEVERELEEKGRELNQMQEEAKNIGSRLAKREEELAKIEQALAHANETLIQKENELENARKEALSADATMTKQERELGNARSELAKREEELAKIGQALAHANETLIQKENELENARKETLSANVTMAKQEKELGNVRSEIQCTRKELNERENELKSSYEETRRAHMAMKQMECELVSARESVQCVNNMLDEQRSELEELRGARRHGDELIVMKNDALADARKEIQGKNEALAALRQEIDSLYASRSWRITEPLRAIKRVFIRK